MTDSKDYYAVAEDFSRWIARLQSGDPFVDPAE